MANFEVFTGKNARATGYSLTIDSRGVFSISQEAYTDLGEPAAVQLLYDRENRVIALRPAETGSKDSYAVRKTQKTIRVSGTAFMRYYGLNLPTGPAQRRTAEMHDGMLQVDLFQVPRSVTSNRAKPGDPCNPAGRTSDT